MPPRGRRLGELPKPPLQAPFNVKERGVSNPRRKLILAACVHQSVSIWTAIIKRFLYSQVRPHRFNRLSPAEIPVLDTNTESLKSKIHHANNVKSVPVMSFPLSGLHVQAFVFQWVRLQML